MLKVLITLSLILTSNLALAAEFFILPGTKTLLMMGETKSSDVETLTSYLAKGDQIDTLLLKGPGGDLDAGYAVSDLVIKNRLNITVPENTDCASACSLIFSSGHIRTLNDGARLGFHLPFIEIGEYDLGAISDWCKSVKKQRTAINYVGSFLMHRGDTEISLVVN